MQASVKAAEKVTGKDQKKSKVIQNKALVLSFVQDRMREGEYFL